MHIIIVECIIIQYQIRRRWFQVKNMNNNWMINPPNLFGMRIANRNYNQNAAQPPLISYVRQTLAYQNIHSIQIPYNQRNIMILPVIMNME